MTLFDRIEVAPDGFELLVVQRGLRRLRRRLEDRDEVEIALRPGLENEIGRRPDVGGEPQDLHCPLEWTVRLLGKRR